MVNTSFSKEIVLLKIKEKMEAFLSGLAPDEERYIGT